MDLLQTGLDEIVAIVGPSSADAWNTVGADSERLLKVWVAKEEDPAAIEVAQQLTDILWELAAEEKVKPASEPASPINPPQLVVKETPAAPMNTPAPPRQPDTIAHIQPFSLAVAAAPPSPVLAAEKTVVIDLEAVEVEESDSEAPDLAIEEVQGEVEEVEEEEVAETEAEAEAEAEIETEAEEEAEADVETEAEEEVEEEVVEPAAEEEEEGMSVEQITIRGRTYWRDTDTDDLYAVIGDDDVGDKVGQIVNGVARFLPLKK